MNHFSNDLMKEKIVKCIAVWYIADLYRHNVIIYLNAVLPAWFSHWVFQTLLAILLSLWISGLGSFYSLHIISSSLFDPLPPFGYFFRNFLLEKSMSLSWVRDYWAKDFSFYLFVWLKVISPSLQPMQTLSFIQMNVHSNYKLEVERLTQIFK